MCHKKSVSKSEYGLDLQISGAGLVNFVFTKWLRPTYAGQKYAIFALNSLNLHRAPVTLVQATEENSLDALCFQHLVVLSTKCTQQSIRYVCEMISVPLISYHA